MDNISKESQNIKTFGYIYMKRKKEYISFKIAYAEKKQIATAKRIRIHIQTASTSLK